MAGKYKIPFCGKSVVLGVRDILKWRALATAGDNASVNGVSSVALSDFHHYGICAWKRKVLYWQRFFCQHLFSLVLRYWSPFILFNIELFIWMFVLYNIVINEICIKEKTGIVNKVDEKNKEEHNESAIVQENFGEMLHNNKANLNLTIQNTLYKETISRRICFNNVEFHACSDHIKICILGIVGLSGSYNSDCATYTAKYICGIRNLKASIIITFLHNTGCLKTPCPFYFLWIRICNTTH